jgi:dTDP-4-dehydrorhamnose reductase
MLRLMKEKESISVVADQYGSPTRAADLAKAIITIVTAEKPVYGTCSWYECPGHPPDRGGRGSAGKRVRHTPCLNRPVPHQSQTPRLVGVFQGED